MITLGSSVKAELESVLGDGKTSSDTQRDTWEMTGAHQERGRWQGGEERPQALSFGLVCVWFSSVVYSYCCAVEPLELSHLAKLKLCP